MTQTASDWERQKVKDVATAILTGQLSILEGTRALCPMAHTDAIAYEDDRRLVIGIESETDHLPVGEVRKLWRPDSLLEKDEEIARCEALWKDELLAVCRRILEK